jgi:PAS domain-containing protein
MQENKSKKRKTSVPQAKEVKKDIFEKLREEGWTYIKTVVDVVREPVLILDKDLRVLAANEPFYRTFHVQERETENKIIYELGNGQWDIPALRKLLEDILPKNTFFRGFTVAHTFPSIGAKTMILNARQIYFGTEGESGSKDIPPIILLAMEDITEIMAVADTMARHSKQLEGKFSVRISTLETTINTLKSDVASMQKKRKGTS